MNPADYDLCMFCLLRCDIVGAVCLLLVLVVIFNNKLYLLFESLFRCEFDIIFIC